MGDDDKSLIKVCVVAAAVLIIPDFAVGYSWGL